MAAFLHVVFNSREIEISSDVKRPSKVENSLVNALWIESILICRSESKNSDRTTSIYSVELVSLLIHVSLIRNI